VLSRDWELLHMCSARLFCLATASTVCINSLGRHRRVLHVANNILYVNGLHQPHLIEADKQLQLPGPGW
jgi:hypothetical protein